MKLNPGFTRSDRTIYFILTAILVLGFSLRTWNIFQQGHWNGDGLLYYELSRGLLEDGRVFSGKTVRTVITQSNLVFYDNLFLQGKYGYILLILISFFFGGVDLETILLLNLLLGTATLFLIFLLGKAVFNKETGLASAALAAFSLIFINYSRTALTTAGSMFFFVLGLVFFFNHLKRGIASGFFHPLFFSGVLIGYAFTIHYNLAYYFLLIYFAHLMLALSSGEKKFKQLKENLIFAVGLALPLVIFEFGYPLIYYAIYEQHVLFTYFQEVLYNALEAGGGSLRWNYFILFLSFAESPAFCFLAILATGTIFFQMIKRRDILKGFFILFALFPPFLLSYFDFPLVGRNLAPSLPMIIIMIGFLIVGVSKKIAPNQFGWLVAGFILALMGLGTPHLKEAYRIQAPMIKARDDLKNKPVLLIGNDELYREAILYHVSDTISVVPSIESILKDPNSKKYFLLAKPDRVKKISCKPWKKYRVFNKMRFRPIRYEDRIKELKRQPMYRDFFSIYDLSHCLSSKAFELKKKQSITLIGRNYSFAHKRAESPAKWHFNIGMSYLNSSHFAEAEYEFKKSLYYNPKIAQVHNNLALSLIRQRQFDKAKNYLQEAEGLAKGMMETQNLYGLMYFLEGELDLAAKYFETAIMIDPNHPKAYQYLIAIYAQSNKDPEKTWVYLKKLKELTNKK